MNEKFEKSIPAPVRRLWALSAVFVGAAILAAGCAGYPQKEINAAQQAIYQAREAEAEQFAPGEFHEAQQAMEEARAKAAEEEYKEAREKAEKARQAALEAAKVAQENKKIFEENQRLRALEEEKRKQEEAERAIKEEELAAADEQDPFADAEFTFEEAPVFQEEEAAEAAPAEEPEQVAVVEEKPEPAPMPEPVTTAGYTNLEGYKVERYETLSGISAKVYGDPSLWWILWDANRDLIEDPDLLPRATIQIPLSPPEDKRTRAREYAVGHVSDFWDGE